MKIKIAPNDPQSMQQDGDAILRSLQNESLPLLDLLIRESLQNSLDATLSDVDHTLINITTGTFESDQLADELDDITRALTEKFQGIQRFVCIRDENTTGLNGPVSADEPAILDKSNFHKLVFGIGKNQQAAGAGGSWGLGKTSFFRAGAGIVIYYTRVSTSVGKYEERLIASLIESPREKVRLLPSSSRGIAWWGKYDENTENEEILPLTDESEITQVLSIFGIERYTGDKTGTSTIIPYLRPTTELTSYHEGLSLPGEEDISEAVRYSVQRWYGPRLMNETYRTVTGNSKLVCYVDNRLMDERTEETDPVFDIFRHLYSAALSGDTEDERITVRSIHLQRSGMESPQTEAGRLAFCVLNKQELGMLPPDNRPGPMRYIGNKHEESDERLGSHILAYARKPAMVVEYVTEGEWFKTVRIEEETCLWAFFVPNSEGRLFNKIENEGYENLEAYLRATETADHAAWIDKTGISLIGRIKTQCAKALADTLNKMEEGDQTAATSGLSRMLGKALLPSANFGRSSRRVKDPETLKRQSGKKNRISDISVIRSIPLSADEVQVDFISFIKQDSVSQVNLLVLSQDKAMDFEDWKKVFPDTLEFPFEIIEVRISEVNDTPVEDADVPQLSVDPHSFTLEMISGRASEVRGSMIIKAKSAKYLPSINIRTLAEGGGNK